VDNQHKVIRNHLVTSAEVDGSQVFEQLLDGHNSSGEIWADSAYRDKAREQALAQANYRSRIHRKSTRGRPLNNREQQANRTPPKVRVRVEHVFAQQVNCLIRTIGKVRAEVKIGLMNQV
jgi:IS5 family transposase